MTDVTNYYCPLCGVATWSGDDHDCKPDPIIQLGFTEDERERILEIAFDLGGDPVALAKGIARWRSATVLKGIRYDLADR